MTLISLKLHNEHDTAKLAKLLAHSLCQQPANNVVLLMGPLGSGKTTFVRHLVGNLPGSSEAEVASPSFTLCNIYPTNPVVLHYDLYRLIPGCTDDSLEEALDAVEMAKPNQPGKLPGKLLLIEWAEHMAQNIIPPNRLEIYWHIAEPNQAQTREVVLKGEGTATELEIFKINLLEIFAK